MTMVAVSSASAQPPESSKPTAVQSVRIEELAGIWEGVSTGSNGELALRAELQYAGGKLTGTIDASIAHVVITSGTLEGNQG
jgi:hypothetical protein